MRPERQRDVLRRLAEAGDHLAGLHGEHSTTNSAAHYTDPAHFARERDVLFRDGATFVALSAALPRPGDYVTATVGGVPVAVVRQDDGSVRAHVNICRHRAAPVLTADAGNVGNRFSCGYHGWTYARDGALTARPLTHGGFDDVDGACGLLPVACAEHAGIVFVRARGAAPITADDVLDGAADDLHAYGLDRYVHVETRTATWAMNWKLVLDTFTESYHIRWLHDTTLSPYFLSDPSVFEPMGRNLLSIGLRRTVADELSKPPEEQSLLPYGTIQYFLVPSGLVVHQIDHVETWRLEPIDASTTRTVTSLYAPEDPDAPGARRGRAHYVRNLNLLLDVVGTEDFPLMERIQRNLASGAMPEVVYGRIEPAIGALHASIARLLAAAP